MSNAQQQQEEELRAGTQKWAKSRGQALFAPISVQQAATSRDSPAKGPQWVSRTVLKAPADAASIELAIQKAINHLGGDIEKVPVIPVVDVKAQWTGFKPSAQASDPETSATESSKYRSLLADVSSDVTILYAHGGFFYTGGAANSRHTTLSLVRETRGRCLVVEYRLAPQNPFPTAIVDLFLAYISLIYPDENALHKPVKPENIVLAGESSGGNLVLALLSLLQYFRDQADGRIEFRGKAVPVPLPAGIATLCAHTDLTCSSDSQIYNKPNDIFYLPVLPYLLPDFPQCPIWPASPPRGDIYASVPHLLHPLASVEISPSWTASNMPPMFFAYGEEMILDEGRGLAQRARDAGTIVNFRVYASLPHIFPLLFPKLRQSQHVLSEWGKFCRDVVENKESLRNQDIRFTVLDTEFTGMELELDVGTDVEKRKNEMKKKIEGRKPWVPGEGSAKL